jgi:hypothetical protein
MYISLFRSIVLHWQYNCSIEKKAIENRLFLEVTRIALDFFGAVATFACGEVNVKLKAQL